MSFLLFFLISHFYFILFYKIISPWQIEKINGTSPGDFRSTDLKRASGKREKGVLSAPQWTTKPIRRQQSNKELILLRFLQITLMNRQQWLVESSEIWHPGCVCLRDWLMNWTVPFGCLCLLSYQQNGIERQLHGWITNIMKNKRASHKRLHIVWLNLYKVQKWTKIDLSRKPDYQ